MKIHRDDTVKVISGKDKGKTGKVLKIFKDKDRVVIEGINIVKRHVKPGAITKEGGIISIERPIHLSNVMIVDAKEATPTKVESKTVDGKKYRVSKKTKDVITK